MPLTKLVVYHLQASLATLPTGCRDHALDSFVALAEFADGSIRLGEVTLRPGDLEVTADRLARRFKLLGREGLGKLASFEPAVAAPIKTCLDPTLARPLSGEVTLCPRLTWDHLAELPERIERLAKAGHDFARVRLTPPLDEVQAIVRVTIELGEKLDMRFRYDAQQAFDASGAAELIRLLDHPTTELLAQPLPAGDWDALERLYKSCPIPLLADEAVRSPSDLVKAADCADYVKLTLAKNGPPARVLEMIAQAREIGLKVILGEETQGAIGCWLEGQIQLLANVQTPGEMTGQANLLDDHFSFLVDQTPTGFCFPKKFAWSMAEKVLEERCVAKYHITKAPAELAVAS